MKTKTNPNPNHLVKTPEDIARIEIMDDPTITVSKKEFELLAVKSKITVQGRRYKVLITQYAFMIGENVSQLLGTPKNITFRKRFTKQTVTREVAYILIDRRDRYELRFTFFFR